MKRTEIPAVSAKDGGPAVSDTPRTDALSEELHDDAVESGEDYRADARRLLSHARTLERELSAARAEVAKEKVRADTAEANYKFMVERAANEKLDGYRELGAKCAAADNESDRLRAEVKALKADVARHVRIAAEEATMEERLAEALKRLLKVVEPDDAVAWAEQTEVAQARAALLAYETGDVPEVYDCPIHGKHEGGCPRC